MEGTPIGTPIGTKSLGSQELIPGGSCMRRISRVIVELQQGRPLRGEQERKREREMEKKFGKSTSRATGLQAGSVRTPRHVCQTAINQLILLTLQDPASSR